MTRVKRLSIALIIVVSVCISGVIAIWALFPPTDVLKETIQAALERATNQQVTLGGVRLNISPTRLVDVTLDDLVITSVTGETHTAVRRINLQPSLLSLLRLHVTISSITVEGLTSTIALGTDDALSSLMIPIPFSSESPRGGPGSEAHGSPPVVSQHEDKAVQEKSIERTITWEVGIVRISEGHIQVLGSRNGDVLVGISKLSGEIAKESGENTYSYRLAGAIKTPTERTGTFAVKGAIRTNENWSRLETANLKCLGEAIDLALLDVYAPNNLLSFKDVQAKKFDAQVVFQRGKPISASLDLLTINQANVMAHLGVQGEVAMNDGLTSIESIRAQSRIDKLPLDFFGESIREKIPVKSDSGNLTGNVNWSWEKLGWKASGLLELDQVMIALENISPVEPLSISAEFELDPQLVAFKKIHFRQLHSFVSSSGDVSGLFSEAPSINFTYEGLLDESTLKPLLKTAMDVSGQVSMKGMAKGSLRDLHVDFTADLANFSAGVPPHFQKKLKTPGRFSVAASISRQLGSSGTGPRVEGSMQCNLSSVQIGILDQPTAFPIVRTEFETKIGVDAKGIDFKDASLVLYGPEKAQKILVVSGHVTAVGSSSEKLSLQIRPVLDKSVLKMLQKVLAPALDLDGKTELALRLSGSRDKFDWSLNAPLSGTAIKFGTGFSKPPGMPASLAAQGNWNRGSITLTKAEASTTGLTLTGNGRLRNESGSFQNVTIDIKKIDLAEFSKLMAPKDVRLSGVVEGQVRLQNTGQAVLPYGSLNLSNVGLTPNPQAGVMLSNINGSVEIKEKTLKSDQLFGRLKGLLDAPIKLQGTLSNVESLEAMQGNVSIQTSKGIMKADFLTPILGQTQQVIDRALSISGLSNGERVFEVDGGSASLNIGGGLVQTQDLKIRGSSMALGAVASYKTVDNTLNALVSVQTRLFENIPLGKIPEIQKLVKQNEGWLKATGLDKELKKFGIKLPENKTGESPKPPDEKIPPTTILFKMQGSLHSPQLIPVLESQLDKKTIDRLKNLSHL
jgi:hypothetical protein